MCVRSSTAFYSGFNLDMGRSPGFGSMLSDFRPLKTRFPFGSGPQVLNLPDNITRRTVLQKVRGCANLRIALPQLVNTGFQVLFHSPPGVLFTVPSQYSALSVTKEYLALGGGPPVFPPDSSCPVVLWIPASSLFLRLRDFYPVSYCFPTTFNSEY